MLVQYFYSNDSLFKENYFLKFIIGVIAQITTDFNNNRIPTTI